MPAETMTLSWHTLCHAERLTRVSDLLQTGMSDQQIADRLNATHHQVKTFRVKHLSNPNLVPPPDARTTEQPLETRTMQNTQARPGVALHEPEIKPPERCPVPRRMAVSERQQCDHVIPGGRFDHRCAFAYTVEKPSGNFCDSHAAEH